MTREAARQFSLPAVPILLEVVEAAPSAQQAWRYTARPGWSSPGESLWMRLSKFSLCNRLSSAELTEVFALRDANGLYMVGPAEFIQAQPVTTTAHAATGGASV